MGFLKGSVSFTRFAVRGPRPTLDETALSVLAAHAAGRSRVPSGDGVECGWVAGTHVLDTDFDWGKNVLDGCLLFGFRADTNKPPADVLRAYYEIDLKALAADNPSGFPSARQKREARESARDRLEGEAKDGRYVKRKVVECLYDPAGELLFGSTAATHVTRFHALFHQTFGLTLETVTAGRLASMLAEAAGTTRELDGAGPAPFVPGVSPADVAWVPDAASRDFLGNEFLLWLWFQCDEGSATIGLADGSEATAFFARSLTLDCPRGLTGAEAFRHEGPTRMPEALRGLQGGKLPRKAGLTLVRHDAQASGTLLAEALGWSAVKLPPPEEESDAARRSARLEQVREFVRTGDLLFGAFLAERLGPEWPRTVQRVGRWLGRSGEAKAA